MRLRLPACDKISKNIKRTHNAHGLKPSTNPNTSDNVPKEKPPTEILVPISGTLTVNASSIPHCVVSSQTLEAPLYTCALPSSTSSKRALVPFHFATRSL